MAQVKKGQCQRAHSTLRTQIIISPSLHHLSKSDFAHHLIWVSSFHSLSGFLGSPLLSLSSSRFVFLSFDMVAEQSHSFATSFCPVLSSHDDSTTTRLTSNQITSSSGEKERSHWSSKLQEEPDIKMFLNDLKLNPRLPSPTSFDGIKPSYVDCSEKVLTFLSVTDYQEFVPILQAVSGHKDVITEKVFIEGVLSDVVEELKDKNLHLEAVTSGARVVDDQDATVAQLNNEIKALEEKKASRGSTLMKADNFLKYVLLHSTSGDPNIMVRRIMRTSSSDCSHRSRNLASNGCHLCRFSANSGSHTPQADHDSHRMESRKIIKC